MSDAKGSRRPLGMCVVGCGQIAGRHLKAIAALRDRVRLVSVVDVDEEKARDAARRFGAPHWGTDYGEAFAREDVDAAVLCLPHHLHAPVTLAAAEAGVHVLCEKPMALNAEEGEAMIAAAERAGLCLMIGHSRRFAPAARKMKAMLEKGAVGRLRHMSSHLLTHIEAPSTPWRTSTAETGGYMIPIFGTHLIDLQMWITALRVRGVYCRADVHWDAGEGEDEAVIVLTYDLADGSKARSLTGTVLMSANCRRVGDDGRRSRDELIVAGEAGTLHLGGGKLRLNGEPVPLDGEGDPEHADEFTAQMREFADAVLQRREPISSGREAVRVMRVLDAAHLSSREGRVVTLE